MVFDGCLCVVLCFTKRLKCTRFINHHRLKCARPKKNNRFPRESNVRSMKPNLGNEEYGSTYEKRQLFIFKIIKISAAPNKTWLDSCVLWLYFEHMVVRALSLSLSPSLSSILSGCEINKNAHTRAIISTPTNQFPQEIYYADRMAMINSWNCINDLCLTCAKYCTDMFRHVCSYYLSVFLMKKTTTNEKNYAQRQLCKRFANKIWKNQQQQNKELKKKRRTKASH